jgi:Fe2+ transport system protein FeoA
MYVGSDLASAPLDTALTLVHAPDSCRRRLSSLGLRMGATFSLVARTTGGGRVALVAGSRIALGSTLLSQLRVEVR